MYLRLVRVFHSASLLLVLPYVAYVTVRCFLSATVSRFGLAQVARGSVLGSMVERVALTGCSRIRRIDIILNGRILALFELLRSHVTTAFIHLFVCIHD